MLRQVTINKSAVESGVSNSFLTSRFTLNPFLHFPTGARAKLLRVRHQGGGGGGGWGVWRLPSEGRGGAEKRPADLFLREPASCSRLPLDSKLRQVFLL